MYKEEWNGGKPLFDACESPTFNERKFLILNPY